MKYKIWDKQESLITPIGEILTAEQVKAKYPMSALPNTQFIICDTTISMGVFMELEQSKENYKRLGAPITENMTGQEVCDAITWYEENPVIPGPSAEERIAASLEFQNVMLIDKTDNVVLDVVVDKKASSKKAAAKKDPGLKIIEKNYERGLWSDAMLRAAVGRAITAEQYTDITGKKFA